MSQGTVLGKTPSQFYVVVLDGGDHTNLHYRRALHFDLDRGAHWAVLTKTLYSPQSTAERAGARLVSWNYWDGSAFGDGASGTVVFQLDRDMRRARDTARVRLANRHTAPPEVRDLGVPAQATWHTALGGGPRVRYYEGEDALVRRTEHPDGVVIWDACDHDNVIGEVCPGKGQFGHVDVNDWYRVAETTEKDPDDAGAESELS